MIGRSNWIFLLDGFSGEEGRLSRLSPVSNDTRLMAEILIVMGKTERAMGGHKLKLKRSMRLSIKGKLQKEVQTCLMLQNQSHKTIQKIPILKPA